jgi:hypothetical protein
MGLLQLKWLGGSSFGNPNIISHRMSRRIKTVGGLWITLGFTPANDLAVVAGVMGAVATVTDNKVYEAKVESICITGGPTINVNGIQEQIAFACIPPSLSSSSSAVSVLINLASTDITKARLVLRRQSDNFIVGGPVIVNNVADAITYSFTGLSSITGYYLTVELYATVGGIDTISSSLEHLQDVCGGNVSGYQIATI